MTADENKMNANIKARIRVGELDSVVKRVAIGHKCRCGKDAIHMGVHDSGIHIPGEAEIVGVDDQTFQNSLS